MPLISKLIRRAVGTALAMACVSQGTQAVAACALGDLAGIWQVNATHRLANSSTDFWLRCTFYVKPNGVFTATNSSCTGITSATRSVFGQLQQVGKNSCDFRGSYQFGSIRMSWTQATMNRSKNHINGVGMISSSGTMMFSATKL